jgi:polyhydroxyalkanoate synthesis repressor PhaR
MAPLLIKKYSNRRLYDTSDSQYITLDQLEQRIHAGAEVRVTDAQTGEDLTQVTLLQIIEKNGSSRLLPTALLTQLIRMRDDEALAEFLGRYMATALDVYQQSRQGAQALTAINPFATLPFQATSALARLLMRGPWADPYPTPPPYPAPPALPDESSAELADLRRQIADLRRDLTEPRKQLRRKGR